jgi:hypothetical protein
VVSIRTPKRSPSSSFKISVSDEIININEIAELQLKQAKRELEKHRNLYDDSEAEFFDNIQPEYNYKSHFTSQFIYQDEAGELKVDKLKIVHKALERVQQEMDNTFFYTQLGKYPNITFTTADGSAADTTKALQDIEISEKQEADIRSEKESELKDILLTEPAVAVGAYVIGLEQAGNRRSLQRIKTMVGDMAEPTMAAEIFRDEYRPFFNRKWFTQLIVAFCKLHGIGAGKDVIKDRIQNFNVTEFNQEWSRLKYSVFSSMYADKYQRKKLSAPHKTDLRFLNLVKKHIQKATDNTGKIEANKAEAIIRKIVTYQERNNRNEITKETEGVYRTSERLETILSKIFHLETTTRYKYKDFFLSEYKQPFADTTPPAIVSEPDKLLLISYDN